MQCRIPNLATPGWAHSCDATLLKSLLHSDLPFTQQDHASAPACTIRRMSYHSCEAEQLSDAYLHVFLIILDLGCDRVGTELVVCRHLPISLPLGRFAKNGQPLGALSPSTAYTQVSYGSACRRLSSILTWLPPSDSGRISPQNGVCFSAIPSIVVYCPLFLPVL